MTDYTKTGKPEDNTRGISKQLRDEFTLIEAAVNSKLNKNLAVLNGTEAQGATVNDFVVTVSPAITAYTTGSSITFLATHANTGSSTLKISALTAKTFKDVDGSALSSGDIASGSVVTAYYDGTDFFLTSGNDRVARSGDTYSGSHDFTGGTVTVATQAASDNSTKAASTAYTDTGLALKANINSPTLTGIPLAPTASFGASGTQIATLDFVNAVSFSSALPSQTGNDGKTLETNGVTASWGFRVVYTKTAVTLLANRTHKLDSTDSAFTVTLPSTATAGDTINLLDPLGTWATNNITVDRNSNSIVDPYGTAQTENLILDQNNMEVTLFYNGSNWRLI